MPQYELNLRDYLRIIRKRRLGIAVIFIIATAISYIYTSSQKPLYTSSATVKVEERKTIAGLLTELVVYNPAADIMESQTRAIKGFPVMKKAALLLGMINDKSSVQEVYNAVNGLQGHINTEVIGRTNVIKISAITDTPDMAVKLANTVAEVFVEENFLEKTKQARAARQFIEDQLAALKKRFFETEERTRKFEQEVKGIQFSEPIEKKLADLQFELNSLLQKYTDKHPLVIQIKEQIKELERQYKGLSGDELEYARLMRDVEVNRRLYSMLSEKLEESRISEAQKISDVSIVDPAVVAGSSVNPKEPLGALVGALLGLVLGCVYAFISENLDTSIGTIEDVEDFVKLPVLGVVPSVLIDIKEKKGLFWKLCSKIMPTPMGLPKESYARLISHYEPQSHVAEAYRNIRTNLKAGPDRKVFLVTSTGPREGKTTVLINIGLVIAQSGAKTLLISSDLRRPAITKSFGIRSKFGLKEYIAGVITLDEAIKNIADIMLGDMKLDDILKTPGIENISILPSGEISSDYTGVLESKEMNSMIEELRRRFDVVLFDSPPVLPITDASLIAPKVDSVIMVYETGKISRSALLRTKIQIESTGAKIIGVVLNQISPQVETAAPYPYYYYKYKSRYYGKESSNPEENGKNTPSVRKGGKEEKKVGTDST